MLNSLKNTSPEEVINYFNKNITNKILYISKGQTKYLYNCVETLGYMLEEANKEEQNKPQCLLLYGPGGYSKTDVVKYFFQSVNTCNLLPVLGDEKIIKLYDDYFKITTKYNSTYDHIRSKLLDANKALGINIFTEEDELKVKKYADSTLTANELAIIQKVEELENHKVNMELYLDNKISMHSKPYGKSTTEDELMGGIDFHALSREHNKQIRRNYENSMFSHEFAAAEEIFDARFAVEKLKDILQSGEWSEEGIRIPIRLKMLIALSNLEPEKLRLDISFSALFDRFKYNIYMYEPLSRKSSKGILSVATDLNADLVESLATTFTSPDVPKVNPRTLVNLANTFSNILSKENLEDLESSDDDIKTKNNKRNENIKKYVECLTKTLYMNDIEFRPADKKKIIDTFKVASLDAGKESEFFSDLDGCFDSLLDFCNREDSIANKDKARQLISAIETSTKTRDSKDLNVLTDLVNSYSDISSYAKQELDEAIKLLNTAKDTLSEFNLNTHVTNNTSVYIEHIYKTLIPEIDKHIKILETNKNTIAANSIKNAIKDSIFGSSKK